RACPHFSLHNTKYGRIVHSGQSPGSFSLDEPRSSYSSYGTPYRTRARPAPPHFLLWLGRGECSEKADPVQIPEPMRHVRFPLRADALPEFVAFVSDLLPAVVPVALQLPIPAPLLWFCQRRFPPLPSTQSLRLRYSRSLFRSDEFPGRSPEILRFFVFEIADSYI